MRSASHCLPVRSYGKRPYALLLDRLGISRSSRCELTPDECFNPPLELFLQVLDGRFRLFALLRVRFASKGVRMRTQFTPSLEKEFTPSQLKDTGGEPNVKGEGTTNSKILSIFDHEVLNSSTMASNYHHPSVQNWSTLRSYTILVIRSSILSWSRFFRAQSNGYLAQIRPSFTKIV